MPTDGDYITYSVVPLDSDRWFVESDKGTSGYSFHSLAEAERFAITLAHRNTPSKVCVLGRNGLVVTETVFEEPPAGSTY